MNYSNSHSNSNSSNNSNATPLFFPLLADRKGRPAALTLAAGGPPPDLGAAHWSALGRRFPCFHDDGIDVALVSSLQAAGWSVLDGTKVRRIDGAFRSDAAPGVAWIAGDWCLAAPADASDNQGASRALALQLVQLVAADGDTHDIEALLRRDARLSYHLLRLVNSPGVGGGRRVTSFAQAILILGRQQLRRWLNLMLFAARDGDVRCAMLLGRVAVRSRMMELLARELGLDKMHQDQAFMAGLFSLLGVLFGAPLADLLQPLAVSDTVARALLRGEGELGALASLVIAAEAGQFDVVAQHLQQLQLPADQFNRIVLESNLWMLDVIGEMTDPGHA